jgi:hypothetical protein
MTFTDAELEILKRMVDVGNLPVSSSALRGLIERLEAAEQWAHCRCVDNRPCPNEKDWLKKAGK